MQKPVQSFSDWKKQSGGPLWKHTVEKIQINATNNCLKIHTVLQLRKGGKLRKLSPATETPNSKTPEKLSQQQNVLWGNKVSKNVWGCGDVKIIVLQMWYKAECAFEKWKLKLKDAGKHFQETQCMLHKKNFWPRIRCLALRINLHLCLSSWEAQLPALKNTLWRHAKFMCRKG